jgi:hypothetical protein
MKFLNLISTVVCGVLILLEMALGHPSPML